MRSLGHQPTEEEVEDMIREVRDLLVVCVSVQPSSVLKSLCH
jgi:hypothetical protein